MNFLIEGDNLASLHLLEKTHKGNIDPKWLSFMKQRMTIAPYFRKGYRFSERCQIKCKKREERKKMNTEERKMEQQDSVGTPNLQPTNGNLGANSNNIPIETLPQVNTNSEEKTQKKKIGKRTIIEIIAGVIVLFVLIVSMGGPSQEQYDNLQREYNGLSVELETTNASLESITNEYSAYKNKMNKFDGLSDEEIEALVAKVDEIVAEQKAKEEEAKKAAEAEAAEAAAAAEAEAAKQQALNSATMSQKNALSKAKEYLDFTSFSYAGLIDQLEYEDFSTEDATYGADNCGADWNEQAAKKAQDYLDYSSFSRQGLIDQLLFEGFTAEQAEYGVSAVGY